jgi:hypothetical protein
MDVVSLGLVSASLELDERPNGQAPQRDPVSIAVIGKRH